jgi:hypothetical protein
MDQSEIYTNIIIEGTVLDNYFISNYHNIFNSKTNKFVRPNNKYYKLYHYNIIYIVTLNDLLNENIVS